MSEKRKPDFVLILKKDGKTSKVEAFDKRLFEDCGNRGKQYRIRVNGRWWPKGERRYYINKTRLKELFFRNL